ncbi:fermentation-respiration switch protein FrsA (DUF1100 family) [Pedobacter sp. UYP30]|uniref:DUF3887 domain-containing protein n=1 Tax=Pedobacter sp. UYP30 TaxID=1756400 RepID=UPI0033979219
MRRIYLLAIAVFFSSSAFSQNVLSLFKNANDFFQLMQEEKFHDAYAFFDDTLKTKLPEKNLQELWGNIIGKCGAVESLEAIESKAQGKFYAVTVEGKFKNIDQNFLLGFDSAQKIVGIFIAPKRVEQTYTLPSYADTALYIEKPLYIGAGNNQLAAVLTVPKNIKSFPIVVFVHGSGPNDMDETFGPNKPFKDLAAGLASKGIASLRYVKRTLIYPNEFVGAFTVNEETTKDAIAAIDVATKVEGAKKNGVYVFGHSLGGMLAPRIAMLSPNLGGIILAAAPARKLTDLIVEQSKYQFSISKDTTAAGKTRFEQILKEVEKGNITKLGNMKADSILVGLPASYWVDLNNYNQVETAKKLSKTRILIVQGGNDFQVSKTDFDLWEKSLGKRRNVTLKFYPELNHLLSKQSEKGTAAQYNIPASVSVNLVDDVANWIIDKN